MVPRQSPLIVHVRGEGGGHARCINKREVIPQISSFLFSAPYCRSSSPTSLYPCTMEHHHHDASMSDMQETAGDGSSSSMVMVFFQATNTPLLFHGTAPTTSGQYAGACIVLVLFAILACVLINMKAVLQRGAWAPRPQHTEQSLLPDDEKVTAIADHNLAGDGTSGVRSEMGRWWATWRATTVMQRVGMATYEVLLVGLGYILWVPPSRSRSPQRLVMPGKLRL